MMKITGRVETEAVVDVSCDVCGSSHVWKPAVFSMGCSTRTGASVHCMTESYEVHLCEPCFFQTIAYLKQERRTANMFEGDPQQPEMTSASLPGMTFP
jgi:hypothetical protein